MPDGVCDAFVAYPDDKKHPAVLLYMDAFGIRPALEEMAKTIASRGYWVLVPNLFYRTKRSPLVDSQLLKQPDKFKEAVGQIRAMIGTLNPELSMKDAGCFLQFLDQQKQVTEGKVALTGYCMGGTLAIRTAAQFLERVACAASFHAGRLATEASDSPHLILNRIRAELYLAHADNDESMPPDQIRRFQEALDKAKVKYTAELYRGAAHGFTMSDLPAYHAASAQRHWENLFKLFERNLENKTA